MNYFELQKRAFLDSFKFKRIGKLTLFEFLKYLAFIILFVIFTFIVFKLFMSMQPFLEVVEKIRINNILTPEFVDEFTANTPLLNQFLWYFSIVSIVTILLFILLLSFFNSFESSISNSHVWSIKLFLKFASIYSIIIVLAIIIFFPLFYYVNNMYILIVLSYLLVLFFFYIVDVYQAVISENNSFKENLITGLKRSIKFHYTIIPIIIIIIMTFILLLILLLLMLMLKYFVIIIALAAFLLLNLWIKNYVSTIISNIPSKKRSKKSKSYMYKKEDLIR